MSSTICPLPWNHIAIQQNGDYRICCQNIYPPFGKLTHNGKTANINNCSINQARNLPEIVELRNDMINGNKNPLCQLCYSEEENGLSSKRLHMIREYGTPTIDSSVIDTQTYPVKYLDIRFGNLCNLKCRYCGPSDSSLWLEEYADSIETESVPMWFYGENKYIAIKNEGKWSMNTNDFEWYENSGFWDNMVKLLPHIDRYYFTGGEPTINKAHFKMLQIIIDHGYAHQVKLEYNTNMVAIPDKLYDQWSKFKLVGIGCSIDGIGDMANYLRYPSKWEDIKENLKTLSERNLGNIYGSIATTISVFNILHFLDLTEYFLEHRIKQFKVIPSFHMLNGPDFMNVQVLPLETKNIIKLEYEKFFDKLKKSGSPWATSIETSYSGILKFMFADDKTELLSKLRSSIDSMDKYRNQRLQDSIPWLFKVIND